MKLNGLVIVLVAAWVPVLLPFDLACGSSRTRSGNYRVGSNVVIASDESIAGSLLAAGANVDVLGQVKGGLRAFGANVNIPGKVDGPLTVGGANVVLSGTYRKKVVGGAANLVLAGTFEDGVDVGAARLVVEPTAVIRGDLVYAAPSLDRKEGAQILGKVSQKDWKIDKETIQKRVKKARFSFRILFWILSIPGLLIVGLLLHSAFPNHTEAVVTAISESPWKNLGIGLVFLAAVPAAVLIALLTLVGIPAGILAAIAYGVLLYVSRIYIGLWIGRKLLATVKSSLATAFFWPLVAGVVLVALVGLIPFLGWLFRFFLLLVALGAISTVIWRSLQKKKEGPPIMTLPADAV